MLEIAVRYAYKELDQMKLNYNHVRNDSVEYDSLSEMDNLMIYIHYYIKRCQVFSLKKLGLAYQWSFGGTWIHPFLYI